MTFPHRLLPALVMAALVAGACGSTPAPSPTPRPAPARTPVPMPSPMAERPFKEVAWPSEGTACDDAGTAGSGVRIARIEALDARNVRFTLCEPDAAFAARFAAGAGRYRVDAWFPGDNVRLDRVAGAPGSKGDDKVPTIILRWDADSGSRTGSLGEGTVDAADGIGVADLETVATMPELATLPREGMTTAFLGFGYGPDFAPVAVRTAFGQGLDRAALTEAAFPPGSTVASHVAPCAVPFGCTGPDWYEANGPAGAAALAAASFDRKATYPLYVPSEPVPGIPDPAALGEAVRVQAEERLGVVLDVTPMAPDDLDAALATRRLRGLYLGALYSRLADASGFLEPLFGPRATGVAADRAEGTAAALRRAAGTTDVDERAKAFGRANTVIRDQVPIVPIAHAGSLMAVRDDVGGAVTSPLDAEPLGRFVPGDRPQLVLMQAAEPGTAWCAVASTAADRRLCGLVTPGLLVFRPGGLETAPGLATRCTPDEDATAWTCRLRADSRFSSGAKVDAGDVVASFAAQADRDSDLRAALPATAFAAWDELFGAPPRPGLESTPPATASPSPAGAPSPSPASPLAPSAGPVATAGP